MNFIPDIILIALIVISFAVGHKKGFVKSVWKIVALAVTIVLVISLKQPAVDFLSGTEFAKTVNTKITESVQIPQGGGVNVAENLNLPEFMQSSVNEQIEQNAMSSVNETVASSLTNVFITIIACVALFIIIRLLLMAAFMIINGVTKLPVIKGMNKLLGAVFMTINTVFIIFLLLALVSLFAPADSELFEMINNTYFVKYFYNYNILLQLFMKI